VAKFKSRFSLTANVRDRRGMNVLDDATYNIQQRTTGGNLRYNYNYKEIFDLGLSAQLSHQKTDYEFQQPDQTFSNKTYTAETNLTIRKNYQLSANFDYLVYTSKSTNFQRAIPLLHASISRFVLKNNSGEIKLSVNNLLDKVLGINQTSDINYIERTTTNSLGRYFMLSFTYALNKQLNPMGMRHGGGIMRVIR
jgi:hypothetical protein